MHDVEEDFSSKLVHGFVYLVGWQESTARASPTFAECIVTFLPHACFYFCNERAILCIKIRTHSNALIDEVIG